MHETGPGRSEVEPLYNVAFFADNAQTLQYCAKQNGIFMKEPYRKKIMRYAKAFRSTRGLFLEAFPLFMDVIKSTCILRKKANIEGTASSYLRQTIEDLVSEDVQIYILLLKT